MYDIIIIYIYVYVCIYIYIYFYPNAWEDQRKQLGDN